MNGAAETVPGKKKCPQRLVEDRGYGNATMDIRVGAAPPVTEDPPPREIMATAAGNKRPTITLHIGEDRSVTGKRDG